MKRSLSLALAFSVCAMPMFAANGMDDVKKNNLEGIATGGAGYNALQSCQALAPSPFGSWVPANVSITVPAQTVATSGFSFTIPARTITALPYTIPAVSLGFPSLSVTTPAETAVIPGSAFLPPAPRLCSVSVSGKSHGEPGHPGGMSTYTSSLSVDFSTYRSNGSGGGCSNASGSLVVSKSQGSDDHDGKGGTAQVTYRVAGIVCDVAGVGSPKTFNGTYSINSGGTGNVVEDFDSARSMLHLDGNILMTNHED